MNELIFRETPVLTAKEVNFNGAILMAVQDERTKQIYVGIRWICDGLGLSRGQMNNETVKIQTDLVLSQGARNLVLPTKGGNQEVLTLKLEFLPLWLAKISITPNMKKENPELVAKLVDYQLNAKDVLANAFIKNEYLVNVQSTEDILSNPDTVIRLATAWKEEREKSSQLLLENNQLQLEKTMQDQVIGELKSKTDYMDLILQSDDTMPIKVIAKDYGMTSQEMNKILNELKIQYKQGDMWFLYKEHQSFGYTQSQSYTFPSKSIRGAYKTKLSMEWTQKGRLFLYKKLKENDYIPMIEQETTDLEITNLFNLY